MAIVTSWDVMSMWCTGCRFVANLLQVEHGAIDCPVSNSLQMAPRTIEKDATPKMKKQKKKIGKVLCDRDHDRWWWGNQLFPSPVSLHSMAMHNCFGVCWCAQAPFIRRFGCVFIGIFINSFSRVFRLLSLSARRPHAILMAIRIGRDNGFNANDHAVHTIRIYRLCVCCTSPLLHRLHAFTFRCRLCVWLNVSVQRLC